MPCHRLRRTLRISTSAVVAALPLCALAFGDNDSVGRWSLRVVPVSEPVRPFDTLTRPPRERWALELKPAPSPAQQFRAGWMRVQLSGESTLTLRPRGGGLSVAWQARF